MAPQHRPPMGDFRAHTIGATCDLRFSPSIPPAPTPLARKPYRGGIGVREDGCHRHPGTVPTPPPGSRYISHTRQQHIARRTAIQDVPLQLAQIVPYSEGVYKTAGDLNSARAKDRSFTKDVMHYENRHQVMDTGQSKTALIAEHRPNYSSFSKNNAFDHTIGLSPKWCNESCWGKQAHRLHCEFEPDWPGKAAAAATYPLVGTMPKQLISGWHVGNDHFNQIRGPTGEPQAKNSNFLAEPPMPVRRRLKTLKKAANGVRFVGRLGRERRRSICPEGGRGPALTPKLQLPAVHGGNAGAQTARVPTPADMVCPMPFQRVRRRSVAQVEPPPISNLGALSRVNSNLSTTYMIDPPMEGAPQNSMYGSSDVSFSKNRASFSKNDEANVRRRGSQAVCLERINSLLKNGEAFDPSANAHTSRRADEARTSNQSEDSNTWHGKFTVSNSDLKIDEFVVRTNGFQRIKADAVSPKCLTAR